MRGCGSFAAEKKRNIGLGCEFLRCCFRPYIRYCIFAIPDTVQNGISVFVSVEKTLLYGYSHSFRYIHRRNN